MSARGTEFSVVPSYETTQDIRRRPEKNPFRVPKPTTIYPRMTPDSYLKRFLRGGAWTLLGTGVARVSTFIMMTILARMLGPEDFGAIGILQSTLAVMGTFAGLGLSNTALRYVAAHKNEDAVRCGRIVALLLLVASASGIFAAIVIILLAPWLARNVLGAPELSGPLMLGSPIFFFSLVAGVHIGSLIGMQRFRAVAMVDLLDGTISLVLTLTLVKFFGLSGFSAVLLLKSAFDWLLAAYLAGRARTHHGIILNWCDAWSERGILVSFSLPAFLSSMSYAPIIWAGQTLLARNSGYDQLGIFLAAAQINFLVTAFMSVFAQVSVSLLSESARHSCQMVTYNRRFNLTLRFNLAVASIAGLTASIWPEGVVSVFGAKFADTEALVPLTLAFAAVNVGCTTSGQYFTSVGRMWEGFGLTMLWGLIFLCCFVAIGTGSNAQGLAMALLLSYWITFLFQMTLIVLRQGAAIATGLLWCLGALVSLTIVALMYSVFGYALASRLIAAVAIAALGLRFASSVVGPLLVRVYLNAFRKHGVTL
jgi:O-antigen/teichoic acid export membrane protein